MIFCCSLHKDTGGAGSISERRCLMQVKRSEILFFGQGIMRHGAWVQ
jgi:hypothetical protein